MATVDTRHRTKSCPFCAETIRYEAVKCRFCGEFLRGDRVHTCLKSEDRELDADLEDEEAIDEEDEADELEDEDEQEEDDDVLYAGRPSLFALTGRLLGTFVAIALCGALYYRPVAQYLLLLPRVSLGPEQLVRIETWTDWAALGLAVCIGLRALYHAALLKSIYYEVTPDRIEWSRGIFDRSVDNLDMFRVVDLKLRRSLWDCLVGIGTVYLTTKDDSDPNFTFRKVRRCRDLYNVIKRAGLAADRAQNVVHLD